MSIGADVALEIFRRGGGAIGAAARGIATAKRLLKLGKTVRPGIGSAVTKGPLKVGGQVVYGAKAGVSTAVKIAGVGAAGGVGIATVASHRHVAPQTSPAPRRAPTPAPAPTSTDRKCCPAGTKRMVCFKRGRVKGKKASTVKGHRTAQRPHGATGKRRARRKVTKKHGSGVPKRAVSAKQAAARKRFAAAARRGPIRKGTRI